MAHITYQIKNVTDVDISIGDITFEPDVLTDIYDNYSEYEMDTMNSLSTYLNELGEAITCGDIDYYENDVLSDKSTFFSFFNAWLDRFKGNGLNYYDDGEANQYFELETNSVKYYDPISNTWKYDYATNTVKTLSETVSDNKYDYVNYTTSVTIDWTDFNLYDLKGVFSAGFYEKLGSYKFKLYTSSSAGSPDGIDASYYVDLTILYIGTGGCTVSINVTPPGSTQSFAYWAGNVSKTRETTSVEWKYKVDSTDMTTALADKLDAVFVNNIPDSSSTSDKWLECAKITTPSGTYQSRSFTFYTAYQDNNGNNTTPLEYDVTVNNSYNSDVITKHSLNLRGNNTGSIGYNISGRVMTVYIKVTNSNYRLRTRIVTHRGYDTDVELLTSCTPTSTGPTYLANRYNYPKSSGITGTNSTGAVIATPNIKNQNAPASGASSGLYYKIMTIPIEGETFGGTVNYETRASGNSVQKSGSFSVHGYSSGTLGAKRLNGASLYYTLTTTDLNIFIISCSSGMKLRFFVPTAGSVDDGQVEMDWILTTPTIYSTGDAILMTDM